MTIRNRYGRALTYRCLRCAHVWQPRVLENPTYCPGCRSRHWMRPRETRQGLRPGTHMHPRILKASLRPAKKKSA
jgi:DNA-directed RNA polymerase subunit RPC12/RpoP